MVQPEFGGYQLSVTMWTLLFLGTASLLVLGLLWFVRPKLRQETVLAMTPWMIAGSAAHALFTVGAYPDQFVLLFGPEAIYFTTFILTGMMWAMMETASAFDRSTGSDAQYLTASGVGAAVVTIGAVLLRGFGADLGGVLFAVGALLGALVVASVAFFLLSYVYSKAVVRTGLLGWLLVFGHVLDGTTTVVAVDVNGTPVSYELGRQIVDFAATLPTHDVVGAAWLLVLLRLVLALLVVAGIAHLLSRYLEGRESLGYAFLAALVAFGLGPGFHHFLILMST